MSPNTPTSQVDAPQQGLTGRLLAGLRNRALALLAVASTAACDSDSENGRVPVETGGKDTNDAEQPGGSTGENASNAVTSDSMGSTTGEAGTDGQGGTTGDNPEGGTTTTTSNPDQGSTGSGDTGVDNEPPINPEIQKLDGQAFYFPQEKDVYFGMTGDEVLIEGVCSEDTTTIVTTEEALDPNNGTVNIEEIDVSQTCQDTGTYAVTVAVPPDLMPHKISLIAQDEAGNETVPDALGTSVRVING